MLAFVKAIIKIISLRFFYFGSFLTALISIFKDAKWGLLLLVFYLPQPNIFYKFHGLFWGKDIIDILFFSVLFGIFIRYKGLKLNNNAVLIIFFIIIYYLELWNSSLRFSLPVPITTANDLLRDWKNFAIMAFLYVLVINVARDEDRQKTLTLLITFVILIIAIRCFREFTPGTSFRWDKRLNGPFEAVGLGSNHLGAFIVDYGAVVFGLYLFDKDRVRKWLYLATVLFCLHPLFFSYSRGAYIAAFGVIVLFGLLKKRSLILVALVVTLAWQTLLPASVVDRISMTENEHGQIEHSASTRMELWEFAINLFKKYPLFGVGYGGYSLSVGGYQLSSGEEVQQGFDSHNFWVKILCEQGALGFSLFLLILFKAFHSGIKLFKMGNSNFQRGLGFGFTGCVLSMAITNVFGDRWSYLSLGSYFWIIWGIVDSSLASATKEIAIKNAVQEPVKK